MIVGAELVVYPWGVLVPDSPVAGTVAADLEQDDTVAVVSGRGHSAYNRPLDLN